MKNKYEICRVNKDIESQLKDFFEEIDKGTDKCFFHPHPFTSEHVEHLVNHKGKDLYYVLTDEKKILSYFMLRGWDEGYDVPSLAIITHPDYRGKGIAKAMIGFLHMVARIMGAEKVRLKVYKENSSALDLYNQLGYQFTGEENGQKVGYFYL